MWVVCNYIRFIHRSISEIQKQTNLVWWNAWINMSRRVVMRMLWHDWMRVCWNYRIRIIRMILCLFYPCTSLGKTFFGNLGWKMFSPTWLYKENWLV